MHGHSRKQAHTPRRRHHDLREIAHPRVGTLLVVALLTVAAVVSVQPAEARRLPGDQVAQHLVTVALREWREWGRTVVDATDGRNRVEHQGARETDTHWTAPGESCRSTARRGAGARVVDCAPRAPFDARARVLSYWAEVPGFEPVDPLGARRMPPWSAAFVSWLMRQVGVSSPAFVADAAHAEYLRALRVRDTDDDAQFTLLLAEDEALRVGDLVCAPRNIAREADRVTLLRMRELEDLGHLTASHCDLVVEVRPNAREARAIGGNVADSVAMTRLPLTADGRAIRTLSRPWFLVVRAR